MSCIMRSLRAAPGVGYSIAKKGSEMSKRKLPAHVERRAAANRAARHAEASRFGGRSNLLSAADTNQGTPPIAGQAKKKASKLHHPMRTEVK